jgi:hypothetical protein
MLPEKSGRDVGAIDLEALVAVALLAKPDVVQYAAKKQQLVVVMGARTQAALGCMRTSENIAADAVIEDELGRGFVHESVCPAGYAGVGKGELFEDVPGCVCHGV